MADANKHTYDESKIKTLSSLEHIRLRTGMYIGRIGDGSHYDDGCYVLLKEVIDNTIDEFIMGHGREVQINLDCMPMFDYGRVPGDWEYGGPGYHQGLCRAPDSGHDIELTLTTDMNADASYCLVFDAARVGAAAGLAATYNIPIGGTLFAMEVILGNFALEIFGPIVAASVIATLISRSLTGNEPLYAAPEQWDRHLGSFSARTDVYALGAIAYELLGGRLPVAPRTHRSRRACRAHP